MTTASRPTIAVLGGAGQEGRGLAARWARAGYPIIIGSRDPVRGESAAAELAALTKGSVSAASNAEAAEQGQIVVLTVPYRAQQALALEVAPYLSGKVVIDVTVPLVPPKVARVQLPEGGSAVDALQKALGDDVRVVAAFQNVSAHQLLELDHEVDCDVLVFGDDDAARQTVCELAEAIGLVAYHAGPLANAAAAEALTSVLIWMNKRYKSPLGAGIRISGLPAQGV
ncbi:MAG TPA: NADPH-dependent F420 reductase [Pedomonas sp.]|uniref:NADPH-dependent F420 reductase n=1 Tax=Pedomonas sp. TaxID=2976421 RepID=UPI002F41DDD8